MYIAALNNIYVRVDFSSGFHFTMLANRSVLGCFFVFPFLPALFWGNITPFTDMPWMDIPNRSTERLPSG